MCKYERWAMDACQAWDDCCFCNCWTDGYKIPDGYEECICIEQDPIPDEFLECRGDVLWQVEQCLQDEDSCRQDIEESINGICEIW